jgi:SCY1-like protein 1
MQTTISSTVSAPTLNGRASPLTGAAVSSTSPSVNPSRGRGLQLGGNKASSSVLAAQLAQEVANEAGEGSNPLWNDDLIDINADEGDWSMFL